MNRYDSITGLVGFAVGLGIILWSSITLKIGTVKHPGPAFLPLLCGSVTSFLGILVFLQAKRERGEVVEKRLWIRQSLYPIVATLGILVFYAIILEHLGFIVTTLILLLFVLICVARLSWFAGIIVSLISTGACYFIFDYLLKVRLPKGWLGF